MNKLLLVLVLFVSGVVQAQETPWCGSHDLYTKSMQTNIEFITNMGNLNDDFIQGPEELRNAVIPVVVHVVYKDSSEIPSMDDIREQIKGLNADFNAENWDNDKTPDQFKKIIGDFKMQYKLATIDPNGDSTGGVTYTTTTNEFFEMDLEDIKYNELGGKDGWDSKKYLNIWVGELEWGLLGYAQFPGDTPSSDGVVIEYGSFGIEDTVTVDDVEHIQYYRILTHEVGHWVGLYHIWGDWYCGDDKVKDTPPQREPHRYCYLEETTCETPDLTVNYMDYISTTCMVMFTHGQRKRAIKAMNLFRKSIIKTGRRLTK